MCDLNRVTLRCTNAAAALGEGLGKGDAAAKEHNAERTDQARAKDRSGDTVVADSLSGAQGDRRADEAEAEAADLQGLAEEHADAEAALNGEAEAAIAAGTSTGPARTEPALEQEQVAPGYDTDARRGGLERRATGQGVPRETAARRTVAANANGRPAHQAPVAGQATTRGRGGFASDRSRTSSRETERTN